VQLLSLYHDSLLMRALSHVSPLGATATKRSPSPHARYTRYWTQRSALYRRVALLLQTVRYTELLCEMAAKRRGGERLRWNVVVVLEFVKAACRLLLLWITRARSIVTPVLPEREPLPGDAGAAAQDEEGGGGGGGAESNEALRELMGEGEEEGGDSSLAFGGSSSGSSKQPFEMSWEMPRTGMSLPSLPGPGDVGGYLLSRVLTADDIKPATKLLHQLRGTAHAAEVLHILAPVMHAVALHQSKNKRGWTPWLVGVAAELAARQLRDKASLRTTALEKDEWSRRGWAMGWWTMRGAFYDNVVKGVVGGARRRMPGLLAGIVEDYEYLWENYYFSTND
jgi:peroxin-16